MAYGICQNKYGGNPCQLAKDKVVQEADKTNFICKNCGKPLKEVTSSPPQPWWKKIKENKRPLLIAIIAVLLIGGGVLLWKSCELKSKTPGIEPGVDTTQVDTTVTHLPDNNGSNTDKNESNESITNQTGINGRKPDGIRTVFGGKATYDVNARIINVKGTLTLTDSEGEVITLNKGDVIRGVNVKGGNTMTQGEYVVNGESKLFTGEVPL